MKLIQTKSESQKSDQSLESTPVKQGTFLSKLQSLVTNKTKNSSQAADGQTGGTMDGVIKKVDHSS